MAAETSWCGGVLGVGFDVHRVSAPPCSAVSDFQKIMDAVSPVLLTLTAYLGVPKHVVVRRTFAMLTADNQHVSGT